MTGIYLCDEVMDDHLGALDKHLDQLEHEGKTDNVWFEEVISDEASDRECSQRWSETAAKV